MPFIDKSTLTYPATNAFPIRKWLDNRAPVSGVNGDYKNFQIFDTWINQAAQTAFIMVDRTATSGTWVQMGASGTGILTITGDSGGAVGPDGANNINILTGGNLTLTGSPGTNTLTLSLDGTIADTYTADAGSAMPAAGNINIVGAGGTVTSAAGSTVTITSGPSIPTQFDTDAGSATPALNILQVLGGTGIATSGAGNTVTIAVGATVATTYTADSGSATPAANNLNIVGAGSTTTSAAGDTVTITSTGGGIMWFDVTVVGPTAMAVDSGYVSNSASRVQLDLPLTSAFGSVIQVVGYNTGGWQINQNAGQSIILGDQTSTVGATGLLQSSEANAAIAMVCVVADTTWVVYSSSANIILT